MILLFFMRSGALFPAKPPEGVANIEKWVSEMLDLSSWFVGFNAKTDDFLTLRVSDIIGVQVTEAARLERGLISVPDSGRMN